MPSRKLPKTINCQKEAKLYSSSYFVQSPLCLRMYGSRYHLQGKRLREFLVCVTNKEPLPTFAFPIKREFPGSRKGKDTIFRAFQTEFHPTSTSHFLHFPSRNRQPKPSSLETAHFNLIILLRSLE